jgi:hypothetical protein
MGVVTWVGTYWNMGWNTIPDPTRGCWCYQAGDEQSWNTGYLMLPEAADAARLATSNPGIQAT